SKSSTFKLTGILCSTGLSKKVCKWEWSISVCSNFSKRRIVASASPPALCALKRGIFNFLQSLPRLYELKSGNTFLAYLIVQSFLVCNKKPASFNCLKRNE